MVLYRNVSTLTPSRALKNILYFIQCLELTLVIWLEGVSEMFGDCDDNLDSEVCSKQVAGLCIEYTIIQTYTTRPSLLHPVADQRNHLQVSPGPTDWNMQAMSVSTFCNIFINTATLDWTTNTNSSSSRPWPRKLGKQTKNFSPDLSNEMLDSLADCMDQKPGPPGVVQNSHYREDSLLLSSYTLIRFYPIIQLGVWVHQLQTLIINRQCTGARARAIREE